MSSLPDYFLLRIAGAPINTINVLGTPRSLAAAGRVDNLRHRIAGGKESLCDRLHDIIPKQENVSLRRELLALRRAIHNTREPNAGSLPEGIEGALKADAELLKGLEDWHETARAYYSDLREGERVAASEFSKALSNLSTTLWAQDDFQTGILFAQPILFKRLTDFLEEAPKRPTKRQKKAVLTFLVYTMRMATKTSPFSSFTATALGRFGECAESVIPPQLEFISSFTPHCGISERLAVGLSVHTRARDWMPLSLNQTVYEEAGEIHFLRRPKDQNALSFIGVGESLMSFRRNALVDVVMDYLQRDACAERTLPGLLAYVERTVGAGQDRVQLAGAIEKLLGCGFIQQSLSYAGNSPHALTSVAQAIGEGRHPVFAGVRDNLSDMTGLIEQVSHGDAAVKAQGLDRVSDTARKVLTLVDLEPRLPQTVIHHDRFAQPPLTLPKSDFNEISSHLEGISELLPLFNAGYFLQRLIRRFFLEKYGAEHESVKILPFYRDFYEGCYSGLVEKFDLSNLFSYALDASLLPEVEEATRIRQEFLTLISDLISDSHGDSVALPPWLIKAYAAKAALFASKAAPASAGYFGQLVREADQNSLGFVINQIVPGYGIFAARFATPGSGKAGGMLEELIRHRLASLSPGAEVIDLIGMFGSNVQLHPRLTKRRLVYPGESVLTDDGDIRWDQISIRFDRSLDLCAMVDEQESARLLPIAFGSLSPFLVPPFFRFVLGLGPGFVPDMSLLDLLEQSIPEDQKQEIRHYPRCTYGPITLLRETWSVPTKRLPATKDAPGDFANFANLRRWQRENGLPNKVFVVPMRVFDFLKSNESAERLRRLHKPFFVDFDSVISCQIFRRYTEEVDGTLTISEMLPLPEQLAFEVNSDQFATEMLVEFYDGRPAGS